MDETGITNVQLLGKIIATKGQRTVGKVTSGQRMLSRPIREKIIAALLTGAPLQSMG